MQLIISSTTLGRDAFSTCGRQVKLRNATGKATTTEPNLRSAYRDQCVTLQGMFKRDAELQVLMNDFSWTKNVVQFLVSVYNTQLNFNNSISLKKCVLYTENYGICS